MADLKLQSCHATQLSSDDGISSWIVKDSENNPIYELPLHWTEKDVMAAIHFARHFEMIAYNKGIESISKYEKNKMTTMKTTYDGMIGFLKEENMKLSNMIEQLMEEK